MIFVVQKKGVNKLILYTQKGCPMCYMLKDMLNRNGIEYRMETDTSIMASKGITHVPMVELEDGTLLDAMQAVEAFKGKGN